MALDDPGSGYGWLNFLASLRLNFVKLDIGLTQGLGRDPYRAAISRKLIELAGKLGVVVIVEGIETEERWRWLDAPIPAQVYA